MPDAMNPDLPSPAAPDEEAALARARTETQLDSLAEARELTLGFLKRLDRVAEGLSAERQVELLAENGQMILNVVRTDRAVRQIVAMEQEVMGLREPPAPRGGVGSRNGSGGGGSGGERLNDLNDLGDLDDPREVQDIHDLLAVEDLGEIEDLDLYYDLAAVEKHETIDALRRHIENDPAAPGPSTEEISAKVTERLDEWRVLMDSGEFPPEDITPEEKRRRIQEIEATMRAEIDAADAKEEAEWRIVRAALLRRRAIEKEARRKRGRRSRGPP
jgi:hypothetical protein